MAETVYIVDEMVAAPGQGRALLAFYRDHYMRAAEARGMVLDRIIVSPPMWLDEGENRLLITWTVDGAGGWWQQAGPSRFDPGVAQFWADAKPQMASHSRYFGCAAADVESLCHV
jgi:hypothetical protein